MGPNPPADIARAFVEMAHSIVWASVATVDPSGRPRTRILHPLWSWDEEVLSGVVATAPTPAKSADIARVPFASVSYWSPNQDTCRADCHVELATDDGTCSEVWEALTSAPEPVGYDPSVIPAWADGPTSPAFAVLKLSPYRLRVMPGEALAAGGEGTLRWSA